MKNEPFQKDLPAPPSKKLRLGLIGLGWVTKYCHLPSLRMLQAEGWPIEIAALCDRMPGRLQDAADDWPGATLGTDPMALLDRADLDGVLILTHPDSSAGLLCQAIERRRTIFVEKPVASTLAEIKICAELASARRVKVQVGYNRRHQPLASEFRRLLAGFGPHRHVEVRFWRATRQEPGFFDDTLVHCLDFISQQLGKLHVKSVRVWPADANPAMLDRGRRIDLTAEQDSRVTAAIDIRPAVGRDLELYTALGEKLSIALHYPHISIVDGQATLTVYAEGNERVICSARSTISDIDHRCRQSGFLHQMAEFCMLCAGTLAEPGCGLEAAMEALRLRDEIAGIIRRDASISVLTPE